MEISTWRFTVEKMYDAKCLLLYKYEGGICSVLLSDDGSYIIAYTDTMPPDEPGTDYNSNTEKEKFDLSLTEVLSRLSENRFLSRRVGFIDRDFFESLRNLEPINKQISQEDFSKFLRRCRIYLDGSNIN